MLHIDEQMLREAKAACGATTYRAVKVALLQSESKMQFSDLIEELLSKWLQQAKR
jgi:hypothetical protein